MQQQLVRHRLGRHSHAAKQQHQQQHRLLLPSPTCNRSKLLIARASDSPKESPPGSNTSSSSSSSSSTGIGPLQDAQAATAATAGAPSSSSSSSGGGLQDVLSEANQELLSSLLLLKDAAGTAFIPGYRASSSSSSNSSDSSSSSSSNTRNRARGFKSYSSLLNNSSRNQPTQLQAEDIESVPARLQRLLTGQFIREAQGGSSGSGQQTIDARLAAIQFELQAQLQAEEAAAQQQQQQGENPPGPVIDVVPEPPLGNAASQAAPAAGDNAAASSATAAASTSATAAAPSAAATDDAAEQQQQQTETYPATTYMLVIVTWAVFLLQWWPALPELWKLLQQAGPVKAAVALLFMYPDTATTQALCLDLAKVQAGLPGLPGFITSGLLHSGLAATWLYSNALADAGRWLEIGWGPMELLATYVITSLCASFAHMVAGSTMVGVAGAGAVMGVYTTWVILAMQHLSQDVPTRRLGINLGVLLLLSLGLGVIQPAIGAASVAGGMLGGAVAVKLALPLAVAMRWSLGFPVLLLLFVLRMGIDALKLALLTLVPVIVAAVQGVVGVVQAVRKV